MMCPAADIMVTNDGPPCGLMLISLPEAERSEGDSKGNKALLTREDGDFSMSMFPLCCIGMKQDSLSFHTVPPSLYFPWLSSTLLYMFIPTKDCLPLQICHL